MNTNSADDIESPHTGSRLRFELIMGSIWLAIGLFIVPAVTYLAGTRLLGPYGQKAGLSTFYGAFFADLASGAPRAWLLALGPLLLIGVVRLIFIGAGSKAPAMEDSDDDQPLPKPARPPVSERKRIEPRVG